MKRAFLGLLAAAAFAVPFVVWISSPTPLFVWPLWLYRFAQLFGLLGFVLLFFQFVLASRVRLFERHIGLDTLFVVHRLTGMLGVLLLLAHGVMLNVFDIAAGAGLQLGVPRLLGIIGLLIVIVVAFVASAYKKLHLRYETWKNVHRAGWVVFPLVFVHALILGSTVNSSPLLRGMWFALIIVYGLIVVSRVSRFVRVMRTPYIVDEVVQETHDTWTLKMKGPSIDYRPGQFMLIRLRRNGTLSEMHPFTISSSPTQEFISVTPKAVGDFTATIGDTEPGDRAYIEAPYGVFSYLNHTGLELAFIAGGIGITPFMSMLRYMRDAGDQRDVVLIWGNKSEADIAFRDELDAIDAAMPSLRIVHVMSRQEDFEGERGFITRELIERHVPDIRSRQVFLCGPPVMMRAVRPAVESIGVPKQRLHFERFAI
jgi:predicted ferric reductase